VSSPASTAQPAPAPEPRRKREILGPTGLIVMVVAILAFTAGSIAFELAANRGKTFKATVDVLGPVPGADNEVQLVFHVANTGSRAGRPDKCEAVLYDIRGERVGTAAVTLREPIRPGRTHDEPAVGTAAAPPVNGTVVCRSLDPG
jgi:hypothetical protein